MRNQIVGIEHDLIFKDPLLRHVVAEGLDPVEQLIEDDPHAEDVDLGGDLRALAVASHHKALWWEAPVGPDPLRRQPNLRDVTRFHDLTEPEVCDLDLPLVKQNILGLDVIMDDDP